MLGYTCPKIAGIPTEIGMLSPSVLISSGYVFVMLSFQYCQFTAFRPIWFFVAVPKAAAVESGSKTSITICLRWTFWEQTVLFVIISNVCRMVLTFFVPRVHMVFFSFLCQSFLLFPCPLKIFDKCIFSCLTAFLGPSGLHAQARAFFPCCVHL